MEVAIGGNGTTPFQREVREWQHVDPNTGALLTSRLEADRWVNGPSNAYGKVVDSKNVSQPNGTQHTQRKQFEVLQARTSSGSLQVVRAQTVHKSSSRWSSDVRSIASGNHSNSQTFANGITNGHHSPIENGYEDNRIENTPSFKLTQRISQNSSPIIPPTSLKLSTLIKNDEKNNAHSLTSSSLLLQHQQFLNERKHNILISRQDAALDEKRTFSETFGGATQNMTDSGISVNFHVRGKSVSIDDLTIEREQTDDGPDSPSEWRRVSKIRRSFQFPKSTSPKPTTQRPVDLPENSVSVSRLREELENGRRLNTAMRGNTIDLVALDNILNGPTLNEGEDKTEAKPIKKATFLTAESLKEIRGKLRKLSDESLYKDDFLIGNRTSETERQCRDENDMLVQNETISQSNEYSVQQPIVLHDSQIVLQKPTFLRRDKPPETSAFTTNSLEGRSKYRDLSSAEWHLRRKSYGFEKMAPSTSSMFRMETSTDSGIGRSSELASWSLSEAQAKTVIMFGDNETTKRTLTFLPGSNTDSHTPSLASFSSARQFFDSPSKNEAKEVKRHSIAVDESKYVRDNLKEVFDTKTSVHLNGLYNKDLNLSQASMSDENGKRTKRVEFCKTEVHFVADSGRVNIVETDGKPPPTNNFRRRRRTANSVATSAYLQAINSGIPVTHFGDDQKPSFETEAKNPLDATFAKTKKSNVTVSTPLTPSDTVPVPKSSLQEEEEDQSVSEEISLRGILKNKPVKPKPYHLGENIDSSESLWGVRLKPVGSKSIGVKEPNDSDDAADTPSKESSPTGAINIPSVSKFAADKLPNLEQAKAGSNYLTKVKLNTSDSWESPDLNESNVLSIEFNSPPSSLKRTTTGIKPSPQEVIPTARPRNITPGVAPSAVYKEEAESHGFKTTIHAHSTETKPQNPKAPLKVGTGGARKLRDHELSYFGVKVSHNPHMDIKIDDRKRNTRETQRIVVTNKSDPVVKQHYKLTSDKPDLLSHSLEVEPRRSKDFHVSDEQSEQEHIYENIDECFTPYSRKSDLERDERNLNEMAREAKLSLKPLKEKRSSKSQLSKSSSYKPHKPLDTINEKTSSRSHSQQSSSREHSRTADKSAKQKIPLSPYSGHESIQRPCRMNRRSSASSNESLSRSPLSRHSHPRRSSEEREDKSETRAIKKPSSVIRECTKLRQRSSSRESRTNASSSEDTSAKEIHDHLRKVKRTKQKEPTKPVEKCEPKLHQSRQAIVTSTARSFAEPEERRKIRNATVHSTSSHHTTEGGKSSRKTVKSERKERSSSASRSRSSSTATDAPKSRTRSSRDAPTTSRSSKPSSTRR